MRTLLSGTFTSSKMRIMYGLIADEAEKFVRHFEEKNDELQEVEMKDVLSRYIEISILFLREFNS